MRDLLRNPSTGLALWSAVLAGESWGILLEVRGPSTPAPTLALTVVVAVVGVIGTALLARGLFGRRPARWQRWVVATAVAALGLALAVVLLPRVTTATAVWYGLLPLVALAGAVVLGGADGRRCLRFGIATAVWTALVAGYWLLVEKGSADTLVWPSSDQLEYHRIAIRLLKGDINQLRYMVGLPLFLGPFELIGGLRTGSYRNANLVNLVALPTFVVFVGGAALLTVSEATVRVIRRRRVEAYVGAVVLGAGLFMAYATFVPSWIPGRNADLVPRRLLGLVFAPEPLTTLFLGAVLWLLADSGDRRTTTAGTWWDPVLVGLAAGLVMLIREPNALIVLLAAVLLLLRRRHVWTRALLPVAVAVPVVLGQVAIWQTTYGKLLAPNRDVQWDDPDRVNVWSKRAERRYGYDELSAPPRIALRWLQTNLAEVLSSYLVPLVVLGLLVAVLVARHPRQWRLWSFMTVFSVVTVVFNSAYINHEVLFRYNATVMPAVATVGAAGTLTLVAWTRSLFRGRVAVAAPSAPPPRRPLSASTEVG